MHLYSWLDFSTRSEEGGYLAFSVYLVNVNISGVKLQMYDEWNPKIEATVDNGTILASFDPWDPRAKFVKMCLGLEDIPSFCQKLVWLTRFETVERFLDIPCNTTFRIWLRSYLSKSAPLQREYWKAPYPVFLPCPVNTPPPPVMQNKAGVVVIALVCAIALLLLVTSIVLWKKKSVIRKRVHRILVMFRKSSHKTDGINNQHILPVYLEESVSHGQALHAHIGLLNAIAGLNIPTYDEQRTDIQKDKYAWVETNLARSTAVLMYHSKSVDLLIEGREVPEDCSIYGDVCQYLLSQLKKVNKNVVHVTFDAEEPSRNPKNMISLVKDEGDTLSIINLGTVVKRLTGAKVKRMPTEDESRNLLRPVHDFYGRMFIETNNLSSGVHDTDPMLAGCDQNTDLPCNAYRLV